MRRGRVRWKTLARTIKSSLRDRLQVGIFGRRIVNAKVDTHDCPQECAFQLTIPSAITCGNHLMVGVVIIIRCRCWCFIILLSKGQCLLRNYENFRWGLTCQPTCANYAQPLTCSSQQIVPDCYCFGNKVRIFDNNSPCVSIEECDTYLNPPLGAALP